MFAADDDVRIVRMSARFPAWRIAASESGLVWEALTHPSPTAMRVICARSLQALEDRLEAVQGEDTP